jgi:metallo-beta-lactamase class B
MTALCCLFFSMMVPGQTNDEIKLGIGPVEPFRIVGNIYYVGTSDLTSYLIVTPEGNIIIDGGLKEMVPQIRANVAKLGFKIEDTKILLNSHAHTDHAGGISELRKLTGARFLASELDAPLLERGGRDDPNFGNRFKFEPTRPDETFKDGKKVRLGNTELTANITSGHTKGCTTWTTTVREGRTQMNVIFVCSVSSPGYKLVGNELYPDIVSDFERTFAWFKKQNPDVFLGSHAAFFDLEGKAKKLRTARDPNPFVGAAGYRAFIKNNESAFYEKLKTQKAGAK